MSLDRIDYQILHHLQNSARMTNAELAEEVGLSPSPCLRRVKAMERDGVLCRYVGIVDPASVGLPINVFVNVSLTSQDQAALSEFEHRVADYPEVMECYLMTGDSDYQLRVLVPDLDSYQRFLIDKLTCIKGVSNIRSSFALKQVVHRTELPLPGSSTK